MNSINLNSDSQKNITEVIIEPSINKIIYNKSRYILFITAILTIILDQFSKLWVTNNFNLLRPVNMIGSFIRLVIVHNYGMIWGLPIKSNLSYYVLPLVGIVVVLFIGFKTKSKFNSVGYGLIVGGAIGNIIDRVRFNYVVDFIDMGIKNIRWPTYNFADLAIVVGLIMIIAREIFRPTIKSNEL